MIDPAVANSVIYSVQYVPCLRFYNIHIIYQSEFYKPGHRETSMRYNQTSYPMNHEQKIKVQDSWHKLLLKDAIRFVAIFPMFRLALPSAVPHGLASCARFHFCGERLYTSLALGATHFSVAFQLFNKFGRISSPNFD